MAQPHGYPWLGLFPIVKVVGPVSYEVQCHTGQRGKKHMHVNDLKLWVNRREESGQTAEGGRDELAGLGNKPGGLM